MHYFLGLQNSCIHLKHYFVKANQITKYAIYGNFKLSYSIDERGILEFSKDDHNYQNWLHQRIRYMYNLEHFKTKIIKICQKVDSHFVSSLRLVTSFFSSFMFESCT